MTPTERQELFTRIYQNNEWKGRVSRSGPGSDPEQIAAIRHGLNFLLWHFSMTMVLDIPCGDFSLFKGARPPNVQYIGADIVPEVIAKNKLLLPGYSRKFLVKDILTDDLPEVDVVVCRDCLPHFSYEDIWQALKNICRTNARYLMTTTFFAHQNTDIETGGWRPLNLQAPPFSFPAPEIAISENCTVAGGQYADKTLSIWQRSNIHLLIDSHFNSYTSHFPLPSSLPNQ